MTSSHGIREKPSAAIVAFMPDYGHVQPLLRVADALAASGFHIHCYLAAECAPLMRRFTFDATYLEPMDLAKAKDILPKTFARSIFFNSFSSYVQHNIYYLPEVMKTASLCAGSLKDRLKEQKPDVIIADGYLFSEWYGRMGEEFGVPVILNNFDGSLAGNQRKFVRAYGITKVPAAVQTLVEKAGAVFAKVYNLSYRLGHWPESSDARSTKRAAKRAYDAIFAKAPVEGRTIGPICVGSAAVERERLAGVIDVNWREARIFPAIRFRSSSPMSEDLRAWMDAEGGAPIVYVSFGSAVELDKRFAISVHEGLRRAPARVLWTMPENQRKLLTSLPVAPNIRFETFVPQQEVLQHPAVRCFVTQGGPWSVQEAWFSGTPMLCTPFFADQAYNASIMEAFGIGRRMWRGAVNAESIASTIAEMLTNAAYLEKAQALKAFVLEHDGGAEVREFVEATMRRQQSATTPATVGFAASAV